MILLSGGTVALIVLGVILFLFFIFIGWYIRTRNMLKMMEVTVNESLSGIDVALTKRFDALTKMLQATKGYAKHEAETLEKVIKWRSGVPNDATMAQKQEFAGQMSQVASGINAVIERYPDLKADKMFTNLQNSIMDTEEHLQAARRLYNSNVRNINQKIVSFPTNIIAGMLKLTKKEFFEAEAAKRKDVVMDF